MFRIVSHSSGFDLFPPNFAPIGAMALFGGFYLPRKIGLLVPLVATFAADLVIGFYSLPVMISVYGSFALINLIGRYLATRKTLEMAVGGVLLSSILFFLITNFAVWAFSGVYTADLSGLAASYVAGLPFLKFTMAGDLFFNGLFFGTYYIAQKLNKNLILA